MPSFFEKLKKGMGAEEVDEPVLDDVEKGEKTEKKKPAPKKRAKKEKKGKDKTETIPVENHPEKEVIKVKKLEIKEMPVETKRESEKRNLPSLKLAAEGELAVDIYQTKNDLVIQSAIAGVSSDELDIEIEKDLITIKGFRERPFDENCDFFLQECFWGPFKKEIILPVDIDPNRAQASMKEGILIIRLPKIMREKKRKIEIRE